MNDQDQPDFDFWNLEAEIDRTALTPLQAAKLAQQLLEKINPKEDTGGNVREMLMDLDFYISSQTDERISDE